MKKIFLIILTLTSCIAWKFQDESSDKILEQKFEKELTSFVDTVKLDFKNSDSTYLVFVANIFEYNKEDSSICFTLGYILNTVDLSYMIPHYIYRTGNDIILIKTKLKQEVISSFMTNIGAHKISDKDVSEVKNKLFPSEDGGFTYTSPGIVYCKKGKLINKKYYGNSDEIPLTISINDFLPIYEIKQIEE